MSNPQTIPLTFNSYAAQIANMAVMQTQTVNGVVQGVDATFNTMLPQALNYAELRIQRDLDLQPSLTSSAYALTAGSNVLALDVDDFVTVQTVSVTSSGTGNPLIPVSKEFLQNVYPSASYTALPQYFAMAGGDSGGGNTYNNILLGPYPDQNYAVTVYGTVRLPSLNQSATQALANSATTFISTYLPDLLIQASMVFVSQFQRQFGAAAPSNNGEMPGSYENQYQTLLKGALTEEQRKRFAGSAWSSMANAPIATPGR